MLKMKPQHRKQGNREHVLYVQCAVCIVRTVYSTCKWDRIVRTVVQYVLWCHSFIGYAFHVNWTNTPQISKANESTFVNYKDSYIVLVDGKRFVRHDVIFELYQNQLTILKAEPADRDPSDPKQESNYTNEEYLKEFDHQLTQPVRHGKKVDKTLTVHVELGKTSLNFRSRS